MTKPFIPLFASLLLAASPCVLLADEGGDDGSNVSLAGASSGEDASWGADHRGHRRGNGWYRTARVLPDYGDYALGFDAAPLIGYVGDVFNNSTNNSLSVDYPFSDQAIVGKYFLAPDMAIRGSARLSASQNIDRASVINDDQGADFDPSDTVIDEKYTRHFDLLLSGGLEKRRGYGRLQGFYGAEAALGLGKDTELYGYGNEIDDDAPAPTTSNFAGGSYAAISRPLEIRGGANVSLMARGFVGAEFFLAPRVSIGGEFGYSVGVGVTGTGTSLVESYDYSDETKVEYTFEDPPESVLLTSTDRTNGSIYLLVHF